MSYLLYLFEVDCNAAFSLIPTKPDSNKRRERETLFMTKKKFMPILFYLTKLKGLLKGLSREITLIPGNRLEHP